MGWNTPSIPLSDELTASSKLFFVCGMLPLGFLLASISFFSMTPHFDPEVDSSSLRSSIVYRNAYQRYHKPLA